MGSYKNFQTDNHKYTIESHRTNIYNPAFNSSIKQSERETKGFQANLDKWVKFVSWARWYPDLWFDLITPESGGIRLDLDQRILLRALARFTSVYGVFPRGWGKCLVADTLILTQDGIKEIGSFFNYIKHKEEFYISTNNLYLSNMYGNMERSNAGVYSGYQPIKTITTEEGFSIGATLNHPLLVMRNGELQWIEAKDIKIGDYVAIARGQNIWGNKTKIETNVEDCFKNINSSKQSYFGIMRAKCNTPIELTEEMALIIGYLIGDGSLTRNNVIIFTNKDEDIINNYITFMENVMGVNVTKITDIDNGRYIREYFNQIGLSIADSHNKEVPHVILSAPKNIVAAFLRGLFDTDGTVTNSVLQYCTVSEKLAKQVQFLLLNFGIVSYKYKKYNKKFKTYHYILQITGKNAEIFLNEIGFSCKRKQLRLEKLCRKKFNTNKDVIPGQNDKIREFCNSYKSINNSPVYTQNNGKKMYIYDILSHVINDKNDLTYEKLEYILSLKDAPKCKNYSKLLELYNLGYFYSRVKSIEDGIDHVYDLSMPETHSFIGNGFINHNTFIEVMYLYHTAIFYPNIQLSMTAQTKENAAKLMREKHEELTTYYPLLKHEIERVKTANDSFECYFHSGSRIDILANQQSTKGSRRKRLNVEESALLNNELFEDVLEPVVNIPRRTIGKLALVNPEELNGQINFFTTSGFRNSSEFERNLSMIKDMVNLKGRFVIGAGWELAESYGRGEPKATILDKKARLSPIYFAQNYESRWVGAVDNALVPIDKVNELRTLSKPELKGDGHSEYVIAMDIARSESKNNNQSSIAILKIRRGKDNSILRIQLVNLINLPNGLTFTQQAIELKRIKKLYNATLVVIDANGLGIGLLDECLKETIDPKTDENLGAWNPINMEVRSNVPDAENILYDIKSQGINHDIIINFMDMVESKKLQLLEKITDAGYDVNDLDYYENNILPYVQTDMLVEEIANLKVKTLSNNKLTIEKVLSRVDKDRWSALAYGLYVIKKELNEEVSSDNIKATDYLFIN